MQIDTELLQGKLEEARAVYKRYDAIVEDCSQILGRAISDDEVNSDADVLIKTAGPRPTIFCQKCGEGYYEDSAAHECGS